MIDQKQKSINDERKKTDEKLASLRQTFNKSALGVDKLPADQQELATAMRDRLAAIDAARKQYAEASDAASADADSNIKRMSDDLQVLQTRIEARKKQLAAANSPELRQAADEARQTTLAAKTKQLDDLTKALADARGEYETNHANLVKSTVARDAGTMASTQLESAIKEQNQLSQTVDQNKRELALHQEQARQAIEPIEPTADDVKDLHNSVDNRFMIATSGGAGIFLLFAIWIFMTLLEAAREAHYTFSPAFESLETPMAAKVNADAEESEPVVA